MSATRTFAAALVAAVLASPGVCSSSPDGIPNPVQSAARPPVRFVNHNGSIMAVSSAVGHVEIRYAQPRPSLGVWPGTLLVSGQWSPADHALNATAYVFSPCGAHPYPVRGGLEGAVLVLEGPSPIIDPVTCFQVDLTWQSPNAHLVFIPLGPPGRTP